MLRVFLRNPVTQFCLVVILLTVFAGVFAPLLAPHDPVSYTHLTLPTIYSV